MKRIFWVLVLIVLLLSMAACGTAATPTVAPENVPSTGGQMVEGDQGFPIVGILVLLAPAAWIVWRDARQKTLRKVKAACCLPVISDDHPKGDVDY